MTGDNTLKNHLFWSAGYMRPNALANNERRVRAHECAIAGRNSIRGMDDRIWVDLSHQSASRDRMAATLRTV
jgi:hypothetical protein